MRSLVVLVLVVAAAAGLFYTYKSLDTGPQEAAESVGRKPQAAATDEPDVVRIDPAKRAEAPITQTPIVGERASMDPPEADPSEYANSLTGRVITSEGEGVAKAKVTLTTQAMMGEEIAMSWLVDGEKLPWSVHEQTVQTSADGTYAFRGIEPSSKYYLVAEHPDYAYEQESFVQVGASGEFVGPDIVVQEGSILFGYVNDIGGNPVPDATVHLDSSYMLGQEIESPDRMTTKTDSTGLYEIKNVSAGPRNISIAAEGYGSVISHNQQFTGRAGERTQKDFRLDIGYPIKGTVLDPNGAGIPGALVLAMNYGNNTSSRGQVETDEDGVFMIEGLRQGSYIIMVGAKGYRGERMNRVQSGEMNVRIDMIEQASASGCVVDAGSGEPVVGYVASVRRVMPGGTSYEKIGIEERFSANDGCFTLRGVDPGQFVIYVEASGYAPSVSEPFDVSGSESVTGLVVHANAGGTIRGRVVDASGNPVGGARVSSHDPLYFEDNLSGLFGELLASASTERSTRSGADGSFELTMLSPGEYTVRATHPDFTREFVKGVTVSMNQASDIKDVRLRAGGMVRGKVYDTAGKVLGRGHVHLRGDDMNSSYDARTSSDGSFVFEHVRPGSYKLSASSARPGAGSDPLLVIAEQSNSEVSISVSEGSEISQDLNLGG